MSEFLAVITGVFKFFDQVSWFVKLLQKTPLEKRQAAIVKISDAFAAATKPDESGKPSGDTSKIEDILNG